MSFEIWKDAQYGLPNAKIRITFDELARFLRKPKTKLEAIYEKELVRLITS
jgi:hypothetical protein